MPKVIAHHLPPTPLIPNSPYPLLHYPGLLTNPTATAAHALFASNAWKTQWIYRYGRSQRSHYHATAHECMAVLSGTATIRFGVADTSEDLEQNTHGPAHEHGGVEIEARVGDVFVIPAGVSHKTFDAVPEADFGLLTPGDGHVVEGGDLREVLGAVPLSGFTMVGAYPVGQVWDSCLGGEHCGKEARERVWRVERPERDPVAGVSEEGLVGLWGEGDLVRLVGEGE
ncbi:Cupin [Teratosphaeria destructans]|uniref:Cupin n=1 Tax=Teratosphaeria destructans TaxID=418781 RepID=A0A9W7SY05_9PEZI|nr:Cupin [Teratosphaeria destructans]